MKKLCLGIIVILIASLSFAGTIQQRHMMIIGQEQGAGVSWSHNLPCTDNAANTTVTNNGTENDWTASVNTNTIYDAGESAFLLNANNDRAYAPSGWADENMVVQWSLKHVASSAASNELHLLIGDGDTTCEAGEWQLWRLSGTDEFQFRYYGNSDTNYRDKDTTDNTGDTAWHVYILTLDADASPPTADLQKCDSAGENCVSLSWGAWSDTPLPLTFTSPNDILQIGNASSEPEAYFKDVKIRSN